jgi:hypothetical protein
LDFYVHNFKHPILSSVIFCPAQTWLKSLQSFKGGGASWVVRENNRLKLSILYKRTFASIDLRTYDEGVETNNPSLKEEDNE